LSELNLMFFNSKSPEGKKGTARRKSLKRPLFYGTEFAYDVSDHEDSSRFSNIDPKYYTDEELITAAISGRDLGDFSPDVRRGKKLKNHSSITTADTKLDSCDNSFIADFKNKSNDCREIVRKILLGVMIVSMIIVLFLGGYLALA